MRRLSRGGGLTQPFGFFFGVDDLTRRRRLLPENKTFSKRAVFFL